MWSKRLNTFLAKLFCKTSEELVKLHSGPRAPNGMPAAVPLGSLALPFGCGLVGNGSRHALRRANDA